MMFRWVIALLTGVFLAGGAAAQSDAIQVTAEVNEGFTRFVIDLGQPAEWKFGRAGNDYALRIGDGARAFDLAAVSGNSDPSGRATLRFDAASGSLHMALTCECHAVPFEFRPGLVVIDLRDGPPPEGSSFENPLDLPETAAAAPLPAVPSVPMGPARPFEWWRAALDEEAQKSPPKEPPQAAPLAPSQSPIMNPDLQPLRDELIRELGRGATRGLVDLKMSPHDARPLPDHPFPSANIELGFVPGTQVTVGEPPTPDLGQEGLVCPDEVQLDLATWSDERPIAQQMAEMHDGLVGEFDRPQAEALERSVKFMLRIGFGAEARRLLDAFDQPLEDAPLWRSLAYLLDGQGTDLAPAFAGMAACDSPAALWALVGNEPLPAPSAANTDAALRAFSALPAELRPLVAARLSQGLRALGSDAQAEAVLNVLNRSTATAEEPAVALLEVRRAFEEGHLEDAEAHLAPLLQKGGEDGLEALVLLVELRRAQHAPFDVAHLQTLEAYLAEQEGGPKAEELRRAIIVARALAGDFDGAFGMAARSGMTVLLWPLLADGGSDSALLTYTLGGPPPDLPVDDGQAAQRIARRLGALGFAEPTLAWLDASSQYDPLLSARAELARGNAAAALAHLASVSDSAAKKLKAEALRQIGDAAGAAALADKADATGFLAALGRARDWQALAEMEAPWGPASAARLASAPKPLDSGDGLLAQDRRLLEESASTRAALTALLAAVPVSPSF